MLCVIFIKIIGIKLNGLSESFCLVDDHILNSAVQSDLERKKKRKKEKEGKDARITKCMMIVIG